MLCYGGYILVLQEKQLRIATALNWQQLRSYHYLHVIVVSQYTMHLVPGKQAYVMLQMHASKYSPFQ